MRKLAAIIGLLLGIISALAAVIFNPFRPDSLISFSSTGDTIQYDYAALDIQGKELNALALLGLDQFLPSGDGFTEEGILHSSGAVMALRDEAGRPAALATRLSYSRESDSPLTGPLGTEVYWNIFWPNEGSVFLVGYESYWPLIRKWALSSLPDILQFSSAPASALSVMPDNAEVAGVYGASGSNRNLHGQFVESAKNNADKTNAETGQLALQISQ